MSYNNKGTLTDETGKCLCVWHRIQRFYKLYMFLHISEDPDTEHPVPSAKAAVPILCRKTDMLHAAHGSDTHIFLPVISKGIHLVICLLQGMKSCLTSADIGQNSRITFLFFCIIGKELL